MVQYLQAGSALEGGQGRLPPPGRPALSPWCRRPAGRPRPGTEREPRSAYGPPERWGCDLGERRWEPLLLHRVLLPRGVVGREGTEGLSIQEVGLTLSFSKTKEL